MFKSIKDNWHKSHAAVVIQNLLNDAAADGVFVHDAAKVANAIVQGAWTDKTAHLFDGRFGQRPHKVSLAAACLSMSAAGMAQRNRHDHALMPAVMVSLGKLLNSIDAEGFLLPLQKVDEELIERAQRVFFAVSQQTVENDPVLKELSDFHGLSEAAPVP